MKTYKAFCIFIIVLTLITSCSKKRDRFISYGNYINELSCDEQFVILTPISDDIEGFHISSYYRIYDYDYTTETEIVIEEKKDILSAKWFNIDYYENGEVRVWISANDFGYYRQLIIDCQADGYSPNSIILTQQKN